MPVMKRGEWLKLSPTEKVAHRMQRSIDQLDDLQRQYDRMRADGTIKKAITFMER